MRKQKKCNLVVNVSPSAAPPTVVVLGTPAGGTSSIAGLLRRLGVFMGYELDRHNHEDLELQGKSGMDLVQCIRQRNRDLGPWGWKDPTAVDRIGEFIAELRNPHFIVVFRDALACVGEELRRRYLEDGDQYKYLEDIQNHPLTEPAVVARFRDELDRVFARQRRLHKFVSRCEFPMMLVSYERLLSSPREFADDVVSFLQIDARPEMLEEAASFIDVRWKDKVARGR